MKWLVSLVLAGIFVRHNTAFWMASVVSSTPPAVSYVMGALLEVILGAAVAILLLAWKPSLWRNLGIAGGLIAMSEGAQMAGCRIAIADIRTLPPNTTLCDHVSGLPIGSVLMALYLFGIIYVIGREIARR